MVSMIMKNSYFKALTIAKEVHKDQVDLSGKPYILHPVHVANNVKGKKAKIVALLHDTIEDGNIPLSFLEKYFTPDICYAIDLLTRKDESYDKYITRIKHCELAKQVKIKDLEHNMDIRRLNHLNSNDFERLNKYLLAYKELTNGN